MCKLTNQDQQFKVLFVFTYFSFCIAFFIVIFNANVKTVSTHRNPSLTATFCIAGQHQVLRERSSRETPEKTRQSEAKNDAAHQNAVNQFSA